MTEITLPKSNHELGYTKKEIKQICKDLKIPYNKVLDKIGIGTRAVHEITGESLIYTYDLEKAIECVLEKRNLMPCEWD